MTCPKCGGNGKGGAGFVSRRTSDGGTSCGVELLSCSLCDGSGEAADDWKLRALAGERLHDERKAAELTFGDLGRLCGKGPAHVSSAERGKLPLEEVARLRKLVADSRRERH